MNKSFRLFLLVTAFFEGGAVMMTELLGAKLMAPYFGNSLYVWAGVLGVTLAGLAGGYFAGSWLSKKSNALQLLFILLLGGAMAVALMPLIAGNLAEAALGMELKAGIVLSCIALLLIPLICFGTVSPLMIKALATGADGGKVTGNVYAVSTAGGIVFTILTGFYFIPQLGLRDCAYFSAMMIALFPLIYFTGKMLGRPT